LHIIPIDDFGESFHFTGRCPQIELRIDVLSSKENGLVQAMYVPERVWADFCEESLALLSF
jgi:hypothetical protein